MSRIPADCVRAFLRDRPGRSADIASGAWLVDRYAPRGIRVATQRPAHSACAPAQSRQELPWLRTDRTAAVTIDELPDPDDLVIACELDGETMQKGRTSQMILNVPQLVTHLSAVLTLLPGDIIFTGTPSGVGQARTPQRFLKPGETLVSSIEGVGQIETTFVAA